MERQRQVEHGTRRQYYRTQERAGPARKEPYWAGLTGSRVALGFLTPCLKRNNKRFTVPAYLVACLAMQLIFCTVDNLVMSVVAVTRLGFFLGPLLLAMLAPMRPQRKQTDAV